MSAGGNSDNISLGAGRLWVAPIGTTEPTNASSALDAAFRAIGYTEDGTTVTIELSNEEIEVAEEYDPVLYVMAKRKIMLKAQLAEATRRNLALTIGGLANANNDASSYTPPDPGDEVAFIVVWDSEETALNNTANIRWLFHQCKSGGTIETKRNKAPNKALLPVELNVEKPAATPPFEVWPNASGQV